jgi:hypothetical protein
MAKYRDPQIVQIPDGWVSTEEAAQILGLSQADAIRPLVQRGRLKAGYVLHVMFISLESIDAYKATKWHNVGRPKKKKPDTDHD